jgi:hypothetical protein
MFDHTAGNASFSEKFEFGPQYGKRKALLNIIANIFIKQT